MDMLFLYKCMTRNLFRLLLTLYWPDIAICPYLAARRLVNIICFLWALIHNWGFEPLYSGGGMNGGWPSVSNLTPSVGLLASRWLELCLSHSQIPTCNKMFSHNSWIKIIKWKMNEFYVHDNTINVSSNIWISHMKKLGLRRLDYLTTEMTNSGLKLRAVWLFNPGSFYSTAMAFLWVLQSF